MAFLGVRSSSADTDEATRAWVKQSGFAIPVLADDGNVAADYFRVPNFLVFVVIDGEGRMRYWGGIDDHPDEARVKRRHLREAIDAVLAGREVARKQAFALG